MSGLNAFFLGVKGAYFKVVKALLFLFLSLFARLGFSQDHWYTVRDSSYQIQFPAKPFIEAHKHLDRGKTRTVQMEYRDYRMNYLFLIRVSDTAQLGDKTVRTSALIQGIAEIAVSLNYIFDKPQAVTAVFKNFYSVDSLPYPAMVADYYARAAPLSLTMRAEAFFVDNRMYLAAVYSNGDRLFDLRNASRFFGFLTQI